ncbi:MAG: hypothetical protein Q9M91_04290 [Candidatus Dojkabacteria bacterium]|nr:hypothetical protein [Candidatus Dojkabacteria bacterium]MDQ7021032.1 hypothetical protein [Candidatus Dojkabacteria bacterium]
MRLNKLEPGFFPLDIFHEFCRLTTTSVIELVPFYKDNKGELFVHLVKRQTTDPFWPNMWHNVGSVIRASDNFESVIKRLITEEIGLKQSSTVKPTYYDHFIENSLRGNTSALIYYILLNEVPVNGKLFNIAKLPNDLIEYQKRYILRCSDHIFS